MQAAATRLYRLLSTPFTRAKRTADNPFYEHSGSGDSRGKGESDLDGVLAYISARLERAKASVSPYYIKLEVNGRVLYWNRDTGQYDGVGIDRVTACVV